MDVENVLIKMELKDEIISADGSNDVDCETSQNCVKLKIQSQVEYLPTNFNNEEIYKTTTSFKFKSEPANSFIINKTTSNCSKMVIEDIFNEDDLVDIPKLEQLLNQRKKSSECSSNIKHENKEFNLDSFIGEEPNVKKEKEEYDDMSEDILQLSESNEFSLLENQCKQVSFDTFNVDQKPHIVQDFSEMAEIDIKIDISEVKLEESEYDENKDMVKSENEREQDGINEPKEPFDHNQEEIEINSRMHKCNICSYKTKFRSCITRHIKTIHDEYRTKITCQFCDKSFAAKQALDDHVLKKHKEKITNNVEYFITNKIYTCKICSYETTFNVYLNDHVISKHNQQKNCQFCEKSFTLKRSLVNHLLKRHKNEMKTKTYKCTTCPYETPVKSNLDTHCNTFHKAKIKCPICDKSFTRKHALNDHLLKQHKKEVNSKIHQCNFCSYQTTTKALLNRHISVHNEQRSKMNCQYCNKSFVRKYTLDDHLLKQHQGEIKSNMKDTIITSKIHKCRICSYATTNVHHLKVHIKSGHAEDKMTRNCQFCDKSFARKQAVQDHIVKQHKEKTSLLKCEIHKCSDCSYQTTVKFAFSRHIKSVHNEQNTK